VVLPELREEGAPVTFDRRTWMLHDAVMQVAREAGLDSFRVECKLGPEGQTVIALVIGEKREMDRASPRRGGRS
jgi:hypothetical protein